MNISSKLIDQSGFSEQYVVLRSSTKLGVLNISLGIGAIEKHNVFLTEVGQAALNRLNHFGKNDKKKLHLIEVISNLKSKKVVPNAVISANSGDSVFFVCKNSAIYDAVYSMLNVTR